MIKMKYFIMASPALRTIEREWLPQKYLFSVEAIKQWSELRNAIESCGVRVEVIPANDTEDAGSVFAAQWGFEYNNAILPGISIHESNEAIEQSYVRWFLSKGFTVFCNEDAPRKEICFGGSQDAVYDEINKRVFFGMNYRSSLGFKRNMDFFLEDTDADVRGLELVDPELYTLNRCFCLLETGDLLWYPDAFSEYSQYRIASLFDGKHMPISREDAESLVCQSISIGGNIITSGMSSKLEMLLEHRNFNVITVNMSEFVDGNSSCASLVLKVGNK
jgi:N-dimethylarginine dimethylaminohydrolase